MTELLAPRVDPDPALTPTKLDRLVFDRGFPLYSDGSTTFAYRGDVAGVRLVHFGIGLPDDLEFTRQGDSTWWLLTLALPKGTRLEYKLEVREHGGHSFWTEDPLNPFKSNNPFGSNSVCRSFGYAVPPWAVHDPDVPTGSRRSLTIPSKALGRAVNTTVYLPHGFKPDPEHRYPLAVFHDGTDYLNNADAQVVLDNIIHRGLTPELVVAFIDPEDRLVEYANHEAHAKFVAEELVPYLDAHLPLIGEPSSRCLVGASFGGIATLSTAVRHPHVFDLLLLQSGSFAGAARDLSEELKEPDNHIWLPVKDFVDGYVASPTKVANKIYMSCGVFESMIAENRVMHPVLRDTGTKVVLSEMLDGHTWGCWRDELGFGLTWLFDEVHRVAERRPYERPAPPDSFSPQEIDD